MNISSLNEYALINNTIDCSTSSSKNWSFLECYANFAGKTLLFTILEIFLGSSICTANLVTFFLILIRKKQKTVFDKIMMAHAVAEFVIGSLDLPFFHIMTTFGYWPFGKTLCIVWSTLDNAVNTITILHMSFISYVRVQCIVNPNTFTQQFMVKSPILVCCVLWISGFIIWVRKSVTLNESKDD